MSLTIIAYLIGQITANELTYSWRKELRNRVSELHKDNFNRKYAEDIILIDPCNNSFSAKMLDDANKGSNYSENVIKKGQSKLFPAMDKAYVKKYSNCCIFNANHYTPEVPFTGTIFELAWYHDQPEKPVIGVFEGDHTKDYLCQHPFVQDTVHTWVHQPEEALDLLLTLRHG